jgi:hypothetical protein
MLKVNITQMTDENGSLGILDIIQWCHKNNRFQKAFGISIYPPGEERLSQEIYLETACAQIMNAVSAKWPNAKIINNS